MATRDDMASPGAAPRGSRFKRALWGASAISLITIAMYLVFAGTSGSNSPVSPPSSPPSPATGLTPQSSETKARGASRAPAEVGVVLIQPKPNARYKLGESIPVEGYLEVPAGASLFEREVYLANSIILPRVGPSLYFSRLIPWEEVDGRFRFKAVIDPPKRSGTYELSVNPPSLGDAGSPDADSVTDEKPARRRVKPPSVRYRVEEAKQ